MSSLTQVAYTSRNVIKYGGVGLVVFIFLWWGLTTAIKAYQAAHPPYMAPTVRFGILDKIYFPDKDFERKVLRQNCQMTAFQNIKTRQMFTSSTGLKVLSELWKKAKKRGFNGI